jgi:S-adenosyl methyltransferase
VDNTHEVAQAVAPESWIVYVDNNPVVVSHAQALLSTPHTAAIRGDLTRPDEILADPQVRRLIDFGRPVALLIVAILHFIPDVADPAGAVAKLRDAMAPGSYLVITHVEVSPAHGAGREVRSQTARELGEAHKGHAWGPARSRQDIAGFFGDLTLVEPGLVDVWEWRPDSEVVANTTDVMTVLGGVARKD